MERSKTLNELTGIKHPTIIYYDIPKKKNKQTNKQTNKHHYADLYFFRNLSTDNRYV